MVYLGVKSLFWLGVGLAGVAGGAASEPSDHDDAERWRAAFGTGVQRLAAADLGDRGHRAAPPQQYPAPPPPASPEPAATPPGGPAHEEAEIVTLAESVIATFRAAVEAGAVDFATMGSPEQVVAALATGVRGGGKFADTVFRVPGLDAETRPGVLRRLTVSNGWLALAPAKEVTPPPATDGQPAVAADDGVTFAGGALRIMVPDGFAAGPRDGGDLLLRTEGATIAIHLERTEPGLDAWGAVRLAANRLGEGVNMSGKKVYLVAPDHRHPEYCTIGFGNTLVSMAIDRAPGTPGRSEVRFALPRIIDSLAAAAE